jgi:GNAT superfamily N-acetyltransferase
MLRIRPATVADVPSLKEMIVEFATFERLAHFVTVTEESLVRDGFGPNPIYRALLPEWDGMLAGYELLYDFYSSFLGRGLFLEDIYVREEFRGKGIGKALMAEAAAIAVREGCWGIRWEVLDWNQSAIDFYKALGASLHDEWKAMLLEGVPMQRLAESVRK